MKKLLLVLLLSGMIACKKDDVVSFGQQTADKIRAESSSSAPTRTARVYIGTTAVNTGSFDFDGEFISVDGTRYNLNRLISYRVDKSSNTTFLSLYF